MARILLAWQYGAGFGHIAQLMPLARELRTRGHEVVLVLADKGATRTFWEPEGFEAHQAPGLPPRKAWDYSAPTDTMADVFLLWGYDDAAFMGQIAGMWKEALERLNPDLVICETAPLVNLVAKGRWPTIVIGSGYAVPPAGQPMPTARFWQDEKYPAHSVRAEAVMTEVANRLRRELKLPALDYLSDLFAGDATFVTCLSELDCFRAYRKQPAIGTLILPELGALVPQEEGRAFVYLGQDDPNLPAILTALRQSPLALEVYIRDLSPATRAQFEDERLRFVTEMKPFAKVLPGAALIVHHGGVSTTDLALRHGIAQLTFPRHLEQKATAAAAFFMHCARLVQQHEVSEPGKIASELALITGNKKLRAHTQRVAQELRRRKNQDAVKTVCDAAEEMVG